MNWANRVIGRDVAAPEENDALVQCTPANPCAQPRHTPLMEITRRNCPQATATPSAGPHCPRREQPWTPQLGAPLVPACPVPLEWGAAPPLLRLHRIPHGHRVQHLAPMLRFHRITEPLRLEKTSKIIKFNCHPSTTMTANPCPQVPHLHIF